MKKLILPTLVSLAVLLSSCLGDSDSTFSGGNQFAVVKRTSSGTKYLATLNYQLTSDKVSSLSEGDALFLTSYSGNTGDVIDGNIIKTNDIVIGAEYPNSVQKQVIAQVIDTAANVGAGIGLRTIAPYSAVDQTGYLLNRSLFDYTVSKKNGEDYDINFYYDASKQVDRINAPLPKDRAVIDVILTKRGEGVGDAQVSSNRLVLNATNLRAILQPSADSFNGQQYLTRYIDFRYSIYDTASQKYKLGYTSDMMKILYYPSSN